MINSLKIRSNRQLALLPPTGEIIEEADDADHVAGDSAAQPVTVDAHMHRFAEEQGEADPRHDPVQDAGKKAEGSVADAVEQGKAGGPGGKADQVDEAVDREAVT